MGVVEDDVRLVGECRQRRLDVAKDAGVGVVAVDQRELKPAPRDLPRARQRLGRRLGDERGAMLEGLEILRFDPRVRVHADDPAAGAEVVERGAHDHRRTALIGADLEDPLRLEAGDQRVHQHALAHRHPHGRGVDDVEALRDEVDAVVGDRGGVHDRGRRRGQ